MQSHKTLLTTTIALAIGTLLGACSSRLPDTSGTPGAPTGPGAVANLMTVSGQLAGRATLKSVAGGVEVSIDVSGLSPGKHGFHIHSNGACAPGPDAGTGRIVDFGAAGGHFDPGSARNHGAPGQPMHTAHAGELPNLEVRADGRGTLRYVNSNISVTMGPTLVIGRTLVIHADPDDYASDPAGNSGPRVLCGLITPSQP